MLVAAAFCPHPPVILPEVAAGASADLDSLRTACDAVVAGLVTAGSDEVIVVGGGVQTRRIGAAARGSFAGFGLDLAAGWGEDAGGVVEELPLSLTVGAWLLGRAGYSGPVSGAVIDHAAAPEDCRSLGRDLACGDERIALLVMADGSAKRQEEAPGAFDARAESFDRTVAAALAEADPAALGRLDPALARDLWAAGRAAWQVAAGAADGPMRGSVTYDEAPYGVGYLVARWERR